MIFQCGGNKDDDGGGGGVVCLIRNQKNNQLSIGMHGVGLSAYFFFSGSHCKNIQYVHVMLWWFV